jgi:hypothetical protein
MKWVSVLVRKPEVEGQYYWKGKSGYGGTAVFNPDSEINSGFDFGYDIPVNKIDPVYLYWLDETDAEYEELD